MLIIIVDTQPMLILSFVPLNTSLSSLILFTVSIQQTSVEPLLWDSLCGKSWGEYKDE